MKKYMYAFFLVLILAGAFLGGSWYSRRHRRALGKYRVSFSQCNPGRVTLLPLRLLER